MAKLNDIFEIRSGNYHAVKELDVGSVPLISCGDVNHGLVGYFDIPENRRFRDAITVAYNGQPLTSKFRPYEFGAKDDVGVLRSYRTIGRKTLVYVTALLNAMQWRFSYGRKCFLGKLSKVEIEIPTFVERGEIQIDESQIELLLEGVLLDRRPPVQHENNRITSIQCEWARKRLTDIFRLERGSFHSLKNLNTGCFPTVSRTESDNGVVGFYEPPKRSKHYPPGSITVSTVSGDAFVQVEEFIATDNVVMLIPIGQMDLVTTYFLASAINHQKWRYSYGRQCYIQGDC